MKKEISAGAVIYRKLNNSIYYLVEYMSLGHVSLCKGHIEDNEALSECAKREIFEETSLNVDIDTNFEHTITYSPMKNVIKNVHFFVAKDNSNINPKDDHDNEVIKLEFLPFKEALNKLTYDSDKETLELANDYIINKEDL